MNLDYSRNAGRRMATIEVFKTNVRDETESLRIIEELRRLYPSARINFDLEDCDKILRFQTHYPAVDVRGIIACVREFNVCAELLE